MTSATGEVVADNTKVKEEIDTTMEDEDDDDQDGTLKADTTNGKSSRHRPKKRKLYSEILKQMEFYFSDANITKNRLMREMVQEKEYMALEKFLDFNRIKSLTLKVEDLRKALVNSDKLELSPEGVKRKVPFDPLKIKGDADVEECTVYVEGVPRHVDHAWLETVFQNFGPIAYVSLPKFRTSNQPKGFAFIEFDTPESAQGCIEAYKGENACLPPDMNPASLMSIQAFSEESRTPDYGKSPNPKKRKHVEIEEGSPKKSRPTIDSGDLSHTSPSEIGSRSSVSISLSTATTPKVTEEEAGAEATSTNPSKKKRKRKKKTVKSTEEKLEGDSIHLKVMAKKSWRQLRNRYLNLQRQNMAKLKKQLREQHLRAEHYQNCDPTLKEPKKPEDKSHIIQLFLDSPAESADAFKHQIKVELSGESEEEAAISGFVKYVDYEDGGTHAYVRFGDDESFVSRISAFVTNAEKVFKSARVLTVQEALDYKAEVQQALKLKRKEQPRKNVRGKDRILKAATKACHIRFDEGEEQEESMNTEAAPTNPHFDNNEPESTTA